MTPRERKAVAAAMATASAAVIQLEAILEVDEEEAPEGPVRTCPECGNANPERIENTSDLEAPGRRTCLECGRSWRPAAATVLDQEKREVCRG